MRETLRSGALFFEAKKMMPGGISGQGQAFDPYPIYIRSGKGAIITDVDGNDYIDYCMAFGPLILGHARQEVIDSLKMQLDRGTLFGTPIDKEVEMARLITKHYPGMEMMRFMGSSSEASRHAIRVARSYTARRKIIKIEGAFHAQDPVLVGSGPVPNVADPLDFPEELSSNTLLVPFNDPKAIERSLLENQGQVAAVMLEPVIGTAGLILPDEGYLQELRDLTSRHDALLIFDEVNTGFRLSMGGAQQYYGVRPDMTVLGKIAGGGLPIGICGAGREIMSDPSSTGEFKAGTGPGNPLSLTAGIETIRVLGREGHDELARKGELIRQGLSSIVNEMHQGFQVVNLGSMFQLLLSDRSVRNYGDAKRCDSILFMDLFHRLLEKGIYLPPSQYETNFLSTAHSYAQIDRTVDAFAEALSEVLE